LQEECNEVVSPRKGRKRTQVKNSDEEPARKTRKKARTVSPSILTEEDSTPLQEERKPRRKPGRTSSHPRDA